MKVKNIKTFSNFGNELNKVVTNFLMDGTALMDFRGLNTLKFLSDFK